MADTDLYLREQTRKAWTIGSYPTIAPSLLAAAARLVDAVGVAAGDRVLDVACGTGNVALTAYRRGAVVVGLDITPAMLEVAREQAAVIDADIDWQEGDAAALPFEDDSFDVTLSCFGHMMVPDQAATATELVRVTEPGGRIGYTVWTPESNVGALMRTLAEYLPPQGDSPPSPFLWSDPETVRDRFGDRVSELRLETDVVRYPALSPAHYWESLATDSGPMILALERVDETELSSLHERMIETLEPYFSGTENAMEQEYRVVTATVV